MQEKDNEKFSFIHEKRKEKPVNKKKLLIHAGFIIVMAVVFGLIAGLVFAYSEPLFEEMMYPKEKPVVKIPKDSLDTELEEETETVWPEEQTDTQTADEESETADTEIATENAGTENSTTEQPESAEASTENISAAVSQEITIEEYQTLQNKLYEVGREANRFVVTVTGVKSDTDWFNNAYERMGTGSGIIIANNGQELLILTERKNISDAQQIYVTFCNDVTVDASMMKYDGNTGITVLSIPLESIDEETMNQLAVAVLGNSLITKQGMIAIAVGSPLGTNYSILTGNITSTTNSISTVDHKYTVFSTDIIGSRDGSGVLVNVSGEVIGLVMQSYSSVGEEGTLTAISISELKSLIEMLSNGADIPYIGLELTTVTNDIAREYDIPKGAYIKDVIMDSPAMAAGLQSGDVIVEMDGDVIFTGDGYENKLLSLTPGDTVEVVVKRQGTEGYTEITCMVEVGILW